MSSPDLPLPSEVPPSLAGATGAAPRAAGPAEPADLAEAVASELEIAALHEAFLDRLTALHVRVLELLSPGRP